LVVNFGPNAGVVITLGDRTRAVSSRLTTKVCAESREPRKPMSLLQHAKQTRRVLTNAFKNNYGRRMPYSAFVDRLNRQPLLDNFKQRHADVPAFATRERRRACFH
jgi:hypothetical protein